MTRHEFLQKMADVAADYDDYAKKRRWIAEVREHDAQLADMLQKELHQIELTDDYIFREYRSRPFTPEAE